MNPPSLRTLSRTIASRTTDGLCLAVLAGGLLTAVIRLRPETLSPSPSGTLADVPDPLAGLLAQGQVPLVQKTVQGTESEARAELVGACRDLLTTSPPGVRAGAPQIELPSGTALDAPPAASDPQGAWAVCCPRRLPRLAIGVSKCGADSLICCWGEIRPVSDREWTVWVMAVPQASPPGR